MVLGVLAALVLAGCATTPPKPNLPPVNPGLAASANQGNPMAELNLGLETLARASTQTERQTAAAWVQRAADANLAMAQDKLGRMYLFGYGVPQDTSEALSWLQRAAKHGAPAAQLELGQLYAVGTLVPVDKAKAECALAAHIAAVEDFSFIRGEARAAPLAHP